MWIRHLVAIEVPTQALGFDNEYARLPVSTPTEALSAFYAAKAGPQLLEALKKLLEEATGYAMGDPYSKVDVAREQARAAIAAASPPEG